MNIEEAYDVQAKTTQEYYKLSLDADLVRLFTSEFKKKVFDKTFQPYNSSKYGISILNIGAGKGGDMPMININLEGREKCAMVAFDNSKEALRELQNRYNTLGKADEKFHRKESEVNFSLYRVKLDFNKPNYDALLYTSLKDNVTSYYDKRLIFYKESCRYNLIISNLNIHYAKNLDDWFYNLRGLVYEETTVTIICFDSVRMKELAKKETLISLDGKTKIGEVKLLNEKEYHVELGEIKSDEFFVSYEDINKAARKNSFALKNENYIRFSDKLNQKEIGRLISKKKGAALEQVMRSDIYEYCNCMVAYIFNVFQKEELIREEPKTE